MICKMASRDTRARIAAPGDFYLCPLPQVQLAEGEFDAALEAVWHGAQALSPVVREGPKGELELIAEGYELSLSRLNHRLPGREAHPEVVQGTTDFHHQIADALLPQADPVFDDATALHTAVDMLDPQPTVVQGLVGQLLCQGEFLAAWFLGRHEDLDLGQRKRQEAQILQQLAPRR